MADEHVFLLHCKDAAQVALGEIELATSIYGLKGAGFETFSADGPISYWNACVGVGQMGGHGNFGELPASVREIHRRQLLTNSGFEDNRFVLTQVPENWEQMKVDLGFKLFRYSPNIGHEQKVLFPKPIFDRAIRHQPSTISS